MNVAPMQYLRPGFALLVVGSILSAGCNNPEVLPPQQTSYGPTGGTNVVNMNGFTWDPEAFWFMFAMCGQDCPIPPVTVPGVPMFDGSLVQGALVNIADPLQPTAPVATTSPTPADGTWFLQHLPSRADVPFFTFTVFDASTLGGGTALQPAPPLPPVPAAGYLPTLSLRPIVTRSTNCLGISADMISDSGIAEAVAKYLTTRGQATTVVDLLNPAKFGGVVVFWMYGPNGVSVRVPAFGTDMQASTGTVLRIDWAPPGALPSAIQSKRGFFVNSNAPVSPIGVTVTLLPPSSSPEPTMVNFTPVDPQTGDGHPYNFPPLPPVPVTPGAIQFSQLPADDGSPPPPAWTCLD